LISKFNEQKYIIRLFLISIVILLLFIPKIFLINNIYYVSKDINKLYIKYMLLKYENKLLTQKNRDIKFKNQVTDTILLQNEWNEDDY
jgi:hypothetical protein